RPPRTRWATRWNSRSRGSVRTISSSSGMRPPQLLVEIGLPSRRRGLRAVDGTAPITSRTERGEPVSQPGRHSGELLDRGLDGEADGPDGLVDGIDGVDGAVRHLIELVELGVHAIDRSSDLRDHGKKLLLRPPNK